MRREKKGKKILHIYSYFWVQISTLIFKFKCATLNAIFAIFPLCHNKEKKNV